jgi:PAS domain S-box-containing protein
MSDKHFQGLFEHMMEGCAYCRMIFEDGQAVDWIFLAVNEPFARLTGIGSANGKCVSELIPGLRETDPELFEIYSRVVLTGKPEKFERYVKSLDMWFSVSVYSPAMEHFVAIFNDVTQKRAHELEIERLTFNLKQRVAELEAIFNTSPIGLAVAEDAQGLHIRGNRALEKQLGLQPGSELSLRGDRPEYRVYCQGKEMPVDELPMQRAGRGESVIGQIVDVVRADGKEVILYSSAAPLIDVQGRPCGAVGAFMDLTEQKLAEEELLNYKNDLEMLVEERTEELRRANEVLRSEVEERKKAEEGLRVSESRYRKLHDSMMDAFAVVDMAGWIQDCNSAYCEMLGYSRMELEKLTYLDLTPEQWHEFEARIVAEQVLPKGCSELYEKEYRCKNGKVFPVELRTCLISDDAGRPRQMFAIVRDITERKRMEESLRHASAYNRGLIEASIDPLVTIGHDGRITDVNSATEKVTGLLRHELIGRDFSNFFTDPPRAKAGYLQVFRDGSVRDYELEIRHVDGHLTPVLYNAIVYRGEKGEVAGVFAAARDISNRKSLEAQLRQARKMEAVGTLTGGIAHEFNNILTTIIGYASILKSDLAESPKHLLKLETLLLGADRAASLVRSLLSFSKNQPCEKRCIDLNSLLFLDDDVVGKLIREDIRIDISLHGSPLMVNGDKVLVEQVLLNLLNNARDAMPKGGIISIRTEETAIDQAFMDTNGFGKPGRYALIRFSDNGEGMDEAVRQKIFDPFFTTKDVGKGTGLGLSVCYGIIKQHGGYIICESRRGKGSQFRIYLPLTEEMPKKGDTKIEGSIGGGGETILVAEDNEFLREMTRLLLTRTGYNVILAVDGREALEKYKEHREEISLVILDVIMPFMNGRDVYTEISRYDPSLKVIFTSGYTSDIMPEEEKMADEGFLFIPKPFAPAKLLGHVRELLDS